MDPLHPHKKPASTVDDLSGDKSGQVIAGSIVLIVLPTVAVLLRLLSRWMARASLWWDDYTVIISLMLSWGPNILNIVATYNGFGRHIGALPLKDLYSFFKILYAFMIIYYLALGFVKTSIILFQYRIFPIIHYRRILFGCNILVAGWLIACLIVAIFQCVPPHDFWRDLGGALSYLYGGRCINVKAFFIATGSINAATNFVLLAMPIPLLWNLKTVILQKLILTVIFTVGLIVCAVSVVRLLLLHHADVMDVTWSFPQVNIWTAAEPSIAVVSACLPSLRPLVANLLLRPQNRPASTRPTSKTVGLSYSWPRSGRMSDIDGKRSGSFNRLRDSSQGHLEPCPPWTNKFSAYGSHVAAVTNTYDMGSPEPGDRNSMLPPTGIRVRTTVTVSEQVDWQDDLF